VKIELIERLQDAGVPAVEATGVRVAHVGSQMAITPRCSAGIRKRPGVAYRSSFRT